MAITRAAADAGSNHNSIAIYFWACFIRWVGTSYNKRVMPGNPSDRSRTSRSVGCPAAPLRQGALGHASIFVDAQYDFLARTAARRVKKLVQPLS